MDKKYSSCPKCQERSIVPLSKKELIPESLKQARDGGHYSFKWIAFYIITLTIIMYAALPFMLKNANKEITAAIVLKVAMVSIASMCTVLGVGFCLTSSRKIIQLSKEGPALKDLDYTYTPPQQSIEQEKLD